MSSDQELKFELLLILHNIWRKQPFTYVLKPYTNRGKNKITPNNIFKPIWHYPCPL